MRRQSGLIVFLFALVSTVIASTHDLQNQSNNDDTKVTRNRLSGRTNVSQYGANNPIEDRQSCKQLKYFDSFVCAIFDGHGGQSLSEYANVHFIEELDDQFKKLKDHRFDSEDTLVTEAFNLTFDSIESSFYQLAASEKFSKPYNTGSCGLVSLVRGNKVYTANVGDSQGIFVSESKDGGELSTRIINNILNANNPSEQQRLRAAFPNDSDIFVCQPRYQGACYVKGRLMPTRALGDFYLKHAHLYKGSGKFNGPYITHRPEILIHELKASDAFIVMASDGLWDEVEIPHVSDIVLRNQTDKSHVSNRLMDAALLSAANRIQSTVEALTQIPAGKRRQFHDDITILVIDLTGQYVPDEKRTEL